MNQTEERALTRRELALLDTAGVVTTSRVNDCITLKLKVEPRSLLVLPDSGDEQVLRTLSELDLVEFDKVTTRSVTNLRITTKGRLIQLSLPERLAKEVPLSEVFRGE